MKIGYVIADYGDDGHQPDYLETRKAALEAEAAGFDSIWLYDHLLYRFLPHTVISGIPPTWALSILNISSPRNC